MDSKNAVNSSQLSEQMTTAIPNEVLTSISADHGHPADIPEVPRVDQTGTPAEDTTSSRESVTVMPDPFGFFEHWSGGKVQDPLRHKVVRLLNEVYDDLGIGSSGR